jgi:hypothetical protein
VFAAYVYFYNAKFDVARGKGSAESLNSAAHAQAAA